MPSQELATHLAIYKQRPDVQGVFHSHSPWAILCASLGDAIPTVTLHAKSKLGRIPVLRLSDESTQANLSAIEALLTADPNLRVFVQDRHGISALPAQLSWRAIMLNLSRRPLKCLVYGATRTAGIESQA